MVNKNLKSSTLSVSYEYLSDDGKVLKKKQNLNFMSEDASDEDNFAVASAVGKILISNPKSIEDALIYLLSEV